ncbi:MAG: hypothetical protein OEM06_15485 [Desulfobacteraceae bacterium]|nr:hypothetical protein [Desulfobacteraceae bacterium]MDH3722387.1 hypothetical protein [Desulfobacteraceae bacterium]MDH3837895.1 hypothetical protein [Desulfobacteraceae bacterium]
MKKPIYLDGIRMRVVSTAEGGEVNTETLFEFAQDGSVVSARYAGGKVRLGHLVGTMSDEVLRFRYAQADNSGRLDGGYSTCEIGRTAEGKIQLVEHFKWESREGSGTNIFEEIDVNRS